MFRTLLLIIAGLVVLGDGYLCGRWSGRWQTSKELEIAAAKLEEVPREFGDWVADGEPVTLDAKTVKIAGFAGYAQRQYKHKRSGEQVTVLVACGRPGPLSVHTPEICFVGAGYKMTEAGTRRWPDDNSSEPSIPIQGFWKMTFFKPERNESQQVRVLFSWYDKDSWTASDRPRLDFAGRAVLYKMYVTHGFIPSESKTGNRPEEDVCLQFVREFLPEVKKCITVNP